MKKILLFTLLLANLLFYAQLDREHWFAPMVDKVNSYGISFPTYQSIYMSTGETVPFKVDVYFNNAVVATLTISKNNPQKYTIDEADRERIIINPLWNVNPAAGLFQPVTMGFYLKGEKPFFASLRFSILNHAEIQTSKGTAALGTEFRAVVAPLTTSTERKNFMNSIMATENNTKVTITEFKPNVVFTDDIPRTEITFILDKGQSYIVEGSDIWYENYTGYIGAKIVSDKPIVVANGNFNGQYAAIGGEASSDILMDQAVPINKLGKTFALVKGNGENSFNTVGVETTMEKAMIVAVKDNTKVYVNGNPTPAAVLNAGEFYETPPNSYINQGSDHYNMFIEATEDIYVYQLLAGLGKSPTEAFNFGQATGGFNYIPPLSCYLPKKIDEIGMIDENQYASNNVMNGSLTVPTKLNIITEKGAIVDVKRNGTSLTLTAANGPFGVSGNSNWITYSISNISGNVAIFSTKAVTAGISAGNDAVGYGGYFAGFSAIPLITKTDGDCLPGVRIEVTADFDSYKWYNKDDPSTVLSTNHYFYPTKAGIYYVKIQTGSCPEIQTEDFKFFNCTTYTNVDYETCSTQSILPKFTLSAQSINPSTVAVTVAPTKGIVTIAADGTITYKANKNETGTDTFRFSFCGISSLPDCEVIQATVKLNQVVSNDADLIQCSNNNSSIFNLKNAAVTPDLAAQKVYYYDSALLNPIPNNLIENFPGTDGDSVYVHLKNAFGCEDTATIKLKVINYLILDSDVHQISQCDNDLNNTENIKLDLYQIFFTTDSNVSIKYFDDPIKAQNNLPGEDIGASQDISGDRTFYYRFTKTGFCDVIGKLMIDFKQPKKSLILEDKEICPDPNVKATLEVEADFDGNVIWSTGETSTSIKVGVGEHYADLTFDGCTYRQKVSVTAVALPTIVNVEIKGSTVIVNATGGTTPYQYAIDNSNYQTSNVFLNVSSGEHTIYVISADHCIPVSTVIYVIQIYNVITPNNDGINDVLNYSDLLKKEEPFLQIFDRMGNTVFRGDKNNLYSWDGKSFGKSVATGSYWYVMKWKEPGFSTFTEYSGWILVKNRE